MLLSQVEAGRGLPDLDDLLRDPRAAHAAGAGRGVGAALPVARLRRRAARPGAGQEGRAVRDGDDREAGRLRRARQHHRRHAAERRRAGRASTRSPGTSGSARRRCATPSWCSRRPTGGLSCFLLPRFTPDGERNRFHIQRLKDKLGNRSNASSEVEFRGRLGAARRRGGPRRADDHRDGQPHAARLRARRRAPGMRCGRPRRRSTTAAHRAAFGKPLVEQPLMQNVLADLAIESEAATSPRCGSLAPSTRPTPATSAAVGSGGSRRRCSSTGPASAAPVHAVEALECLGGNGYVEESGMPRLYRESPLNSIWEGSGNVQCLDVLRAMAAQPAVRSRPSSPRSSEARGADRRLDARRRRAARRARRPRGRSRAVRARVVERMALALQASLLVRYGDRRSPTRSAPRASTATRAARSAPCRAASTSAAIIERHRTPGRPSRASARPGGGPRPR